jgi:hypothetical protein
MKAVNGGRLQHMPEGDREMAVYDQRPHRRRPPTFMLGALLVIVVRLAGGATIWSATDNSGTNTAVGRSTIDDPASATHDALKVNRPVRSFRRRNDAHKLYRPTDFGH